MDIDRASPRRKGWVPDGFVQWGSVTRGAPITVQDSLPLPAPVHVSISTQDSPLKRTLLALNETLGRLSTTDETVGHVLGKHKYLFNGSAACNALTEHVLSGIPASLAPSFLQGTFTVQDLLNAPEITGETSGSGIYVQLYEMPNTQRNVLRIGSTNNFWRRAKDHRRETNNVENTSKCFASTVCSVPVLI